VDDGDDLEAGVAARRANNNNNINTATESKYAVLYEEKVNPFKAFRKRQKLQSYKKLSTSEKITLRVGQFCLSKKSVRSCLFFYALALHALVFITLWMHTVTDHCASHGDHELGPPQI
jgi:homeobox protein cut-like